MDERVCLEADVEDAASHRLLGDNEHETRLASKRCWAWLGWTELAVDNEKQHDNSKHPSTALLALYLWEGPPKDQMPG